MSRRLTESERRVWMLHTGGLCVSQICQVTGFDALHVRSVITGVWYDDRQAAKRER